MLAKIVRMVPPAQLTDDDLEIAETACRNLAERYRETAARHTIPELRDNFLSAAASCERMAEQIKRDRKRH
jgi:hypothetical protein